jgi:hypothetical protein
MAAPSNTALRSPRVERRRRPRRGPSGPFTTRGRAATLEDRMITTWSQLATGVAVTCPVCAREELVATGCSGCGSHLS